MQGFMGRAFLIPQDKAPQGQTVLYLNFGFNSVGNQVFPTYRDAIYGQYFSAEQYSRVTSRIKEYIDQHGTNVCCGKLAIMLASMSVCVLSCPMCYLHYKVGEIDNQLQKIIQEESSDWKCDARLVRHDACHPVARSPVTMGYDETGTALEYQSPQGNANQSPVWPPLGYNIILTIQGTTLRTRWSQLSIDPAIKAAVAAAIAPAQLVMPGVEKPSLATQLSQLADLKAKGALSEEEYVAAKGKLLG
jgi:hypothetical protein